MTVSLLKTKGKNGYYRMILPITVRNVLAVGTIFFTLESSHIDPESLKIWYIIPFDSNDPHTKNVGGFVHHVRTGICYDGLPCHGADLTSDAFDSRKGYGSVGK